MVKSWMWSVKRISRQPPRKGMMISEACLASILELPSQLPFSASLVFEQSYGEIDGDSASLAIFLY